jgi:hypothetical protein
MDHTIFMREMYANECTMNGRRETWTAPLGRRFSTTGGRLCELEGEGRRPLLDANLYQPEQVRTPEWALLW